ncbi:MAG: hypothetical protein C4567_02990 [Deltaproteobacteria bacterium]|nr:MAG: hypothetical protein C4567_02990 [Deltaproteobacteria bacterium]
MLIVNILRENILTVKLPKFYGLVWIRFGAGLWLSFRQTLQQNGEKEKNENMISTRLLKFI